MEEGLRRCRLSVAERGDDGSEERWREGAAGSLTERESGGNEEWRRGVAAAGSRGRRSGAVMEAVEEERGWGEEGRMNGGWERDGMKVGEREGRR